jgi:hypothetical protein
MLSRIINFYVTEQIEKEDNEKIWMYSGIIIPGYIKSVMCLDKVNTIYKNGCETELYCSSKPYTLNEYQQKYSYEGDDSKLYWKE